MSDSSTASSPAEQVVAAFAARVATRDNPPPPPPLPRDRESVLGRVAAAFLHDHNVRNKRLRRTLAGFCYGLLGQPERAAADLAQEIGCVRQTAAQAASLLIGLDLFVARPAGRRRFYGLTRAGEDWLLPLVVGPAARP